MAGSYNHVVDDDGRLLSNERVAGMLENGGDVYEAVEEMYGMIWRLADRLEGYLAESRYANDDGAAHWVEEARKGFEEGLDLSPGLREGRTVTEKVRAQMGQHLPLCPHGACSETGTHGHGTDQRYRPRPR